MVGDGDVERYGEVALIGHEPSGDIFANHLHIGERHHGLFAIDIKSDLPVGFKLCNLRLFQCGESLCSSLHIFTKLRSQLFEIGFDTLHEDTFVASHIVDALHIHLIHNQICHRLDVLLLAIVEHRNHDGGERLFHLQILLAA